MADERAALDDSVARLREVVAPLGPDDLRAQAYPTEWSVADVLSHVGSGAEIFANRVDEELGGEARPPQPVWDEWNAKDPDAKAADALASDQALFTRLDAMTDDERAGFTTSLGPMQLDFAGLLRMRVNEHVVHTWDVEVTFDPTAEIPADAVPVLMEVVPMLAGFAGKPTGSTRDIRVRTTAPDRTFVISLKPDGVSVTPNSAGGSADLELPGAAFVRLAYGRLDPDHTPAFTGAEADLDELRRAFPGF